jgi:hypothetical protein
MPADVNASAPSTGGPAPREGKVSLDQFLNQVLPKK